MANLIDVVHQLRGLPESKYECVVPASPEIYESFRGSLPRLTTFTRDDLELMTRGVHAKVPVRSRTIPEEAFDPNDMVSALAAVTTDGAKLANVAPALQDNAAVVATAVAQNGRALEHASARLRDDPDIVMRAVLNTGDALYYASDAQRGNAAIAETAVTNFGEAISDVPSRAVTPGLIALAISDDPSALQHAPWLTGEYKL